MSLRRRLLPVALSSRSGRVGLCAVLSVVGVTVVLGASAGLAQQPQAAAGSSSQSGPPVAPISPPRRPVGADPAALRRFVAERDEARRGEKAARDSEAARRERAASRTRYRDLDRGQARELARKHLKRAFERRDPVKRPGVTVDAYLGERAARVELSSGQKAIVESLMPLRAPDASGALKPIDLTVRDYGDAFAPVHSVSRVRLPKRLREGGVELGEQGVRIKIPAPQSDTPGSDEDGGVFYANAEPATDVIVVPEMTGVEIFHLLRSSDAPERFVLGYEGGVVLRETKEGGVDVLRDEKLLARVSPPMGWAADGQPVPMRLRADGDKLVVEVDHRDGDFKYPIVADPYTGEDFAYVDGRTAWWDQTGWDRVSTAATNGNPRRFFEDQQCTDTAGRFCFGHWPGWIYGTGLYTWMRAGYTPGFDNTYNYGDIGEWVFQAPGQAYIFRFDMWQLRNEYDSSCSYQGIFSPSSNHWEEQSYWDPRGGAHSPARPAGDYPPRMRCGSDTTDWLAVCSGAWECRDGEADTARHIRESGNYLVFGTQIFDTQVPSFTNFMGAANISIGDRDNPQITALSGPTGWTRDTTAKITASANDPGLGVRQLKLYAPDQPTWNGTRDTQPVCSGDRNSRCSTSRSHTVDIGDLREGRNRILAQATDPVDRQSAPQEINVNVDRSAPTAPENVTASVEPGGRARIEWMTAQDPVLSDGSDGSGVSSHAVRYRRPGGQWTELVVPETSAYFDGAAPGEMIEIEVSGRDTAGNVGSTASATVTLGASSAESCAPPPGSEPDACQESPGGGAVDSEPDPEVELAEDPDTFRQQSGSPANVYRLQSGQDRCRTQRCWTTIRSKAKSWAVGNVRLMYSGESWEESLRVRSTVAAVENKDGYVSGAMSWRGFNCHWVGGFVRSTLERETTSSCSPGAADADYRDFQASPFGGRRAGRLVRGNNCFRDDGTWLRAGGEGCDHGTAIYLAGPSFQCADVSLLPDASSTRASCGDGDVIKRLGGDEWKGYCVDWRYVTKDGRWVLVRDTTAGRDVIDGGWVFMPRSSFAQDRGSWPAFDVGVIGRGGGRGTCNQEENLP
ncbi:MAG: fibronectin type III domain-containing protein [Propionibacteriales bacterium]|nr:fibronectin type III domain-containing protein [Propionibacteriales bacterium]